MESKFRGCRKTSGTRELQAGLDTGSAVGTVKEGAEEKIVERKWCSGVF